MHLPGEPIGPKVLSTMRVIYGDTDMMGVVYYANYLRYFEASRSDFFRARGGRYQDVEASGHTLPVVEAHATYKASARYDDLLEVTVWLSLVKRASLRFEYEVRRAGQELLLCRGHTVHACVGADGKPAPLPPDLAALLRAP